MRPCSGEARAQHAGACGPDRTACTSIAAWMQRCRRSQASLHPASWGSSQAGAGAGPFGLQRPAHRYEFCVGDVGPVAAPPDEVAVQQTATAVCGGRAAASTAGGWLPQGKQGCQLCADAAVSSKLQQLGLKWCSTREGTDAAAGPLLRGLSTAHIRSP